MTEKTQPWTDEQRRDIHESVSWMAKQTRQGPDYHTIKAQRDALLEALRDLMARLDPYDYPDEQNFARAAIAKAEEA